VAGVRGDAVGGGVTVSTGVFGDDVFVDVSGVEVCTGMRPSSIGFPFQIKRKN
jgi:hypothetical protein